MKKLLFVLLSLTLVACGRPYSSYDHRIAVIPGTPGQDGISMGIEVSSSAPSCLAGGATVRTYIDANRNSELDLNEIVKQVAVICNGVNGTNGSNGIDGTSITVATASITDCPNGGILVNSTTPICNGVNGVMGPQGDVGVTGPQGPSGAQGPVGIAGQNGKSAYQIWIDLGNVGTESAFLASLTGPTGATGSSGSNGSNGSNGLSAYQIWLSLGNTGTQTQFLMSLVGPQGSSGSIGPVGPQGPVGPAGGVGNMTPVQLCPGDTATFKEYGFVVNHELFAVYYDKNEHIAFLAKLNVGNYITTNGSNCTFNYSKTGTAAVLSNGSGTTTVNF